MSRSQDRRDEVDVSVSIDSDVVDAHDRRRTRVERVRELTIGYQRDEAPTRHSYQAGVVESNDLSVAHGELTGPIGGIGDG